MGSVRSLERETVKRTRSSNAAGRSSPASDTSRSINSSRTTDSSCGGREEDQFRNEGSAEKKGKIAYLQRRGERPKSPKQSLSIEEGKYRQRKSSAEVRSRATEKVFRGRRRDEPDPPTPPVAAAPPPTPADPPRPAEPPTPARTGKGSVSEKEGEERLLTSDASMTASRSRSGSYMGRAS
jgi:hypothetical protein